MNNLKPSDVPVSTFLAVVVVIVFSLYLTSAIKAIPCGKDVLSQFFSNFVHVDIAHMLSNLYSLYALSRVETRLGSKSFMTLVIVLLVSNTVIETLLHKLKPDMKCSIGFSGVLFGIVAWEMTSSRKIDMYLLSAIALQVITPSLSSSKVSFAGHAVGAISGVVVGSIWAKIQKNSTQSKFIT
jgi:membrane associated rhomboid family serine protease